MEQVEIKKAYKGSPVTIKSGVFKNNEACVETINNNRVRLKLPQLGISINIKLREISLNAATSPLQF